MAELEKQVEHRLVEGVKRLGGRSYKWVSPGNVGVPDRIVIWPTGQVDFVELKTVSGRLSPRQEIVILQLADMGCSVRVLRGAEAVAGYLLEDHSKVILEGGDGK